MSQKITGWKTVYHTNFRECLQAILRVHSSHGTQYPSGLQIVGHTGLGKTLLCEEVIRRLPTVHDEGGPRIRVLRVEIPASPTEKTLLIEILRALGDPTPTYGTRAKMEDRLYRLLKNARIELLLVDEIQHFVVKGARVSIDATADVFKSLINRARIPVVMFGMPSSRSLFMLNAQLRSRVPLEMKLRPFVWDAESDKGEFLAVFKAQFPLGFNNDEFLFDEGVGRLLWLATNGNLRAMRHIGLELMRMASKHPSLNLWVLSEAFRAVLWGDAPDHRNPFMKEFDGNMLIRLGEPYARDPMEGGSHDSPKVVSGAIRAIQKRVNRATGDGDGGEPVAC